MDMSVDKSRYQVVLPEVYDLLALPVIAQAGNQTLAYGHIGLLNLGGDGVHHPGVHQEQISGGVAPGGRERTLYIHS
ncbi:MAG: hypothetical protein DDT24_00608 [Chloroflexi bacterium]|nr:hypothetical protein [Chloroflexota bacterium]MBT9163688.1 hypothetical protein [Chloroflexota bacterium]